MGRAIRYGSLLVVVAVATGCVRQIPIVSAQVMSDVDLASLQSFYVATHEGDRGVGGFIVDDLRARGKDVRAGTTSAPADGTQVLVVYDDRWWWDLGMYLLLLRIEFRDADTNVLLAAGSSNRASVARGEPKEVVTETLAGIFQGGVLAYPDLVTDDAGR